MRSSRRAALRQAAEARSRRRKLEREQASQQQRRQSRQVARALDRTTWTLTRALERGRWDRIDPALLTSGAMRDQRAHRYNVVVADKHTDKPALIAEWISQVFI